MRHKPKTFNQLQEEWYAKLKKEGFEDIEQTDTKERLLKSWHSSYFHSRHNPHDFRHQEEYFRQATNFYHSHDFKNQAEKKIWLLHSEGYTIREISSHFKNKAGFKRAWVHQTVKRLTAIMLDSLEDS
jgi:hypothetical protein